MTSNTLSEVEKQLADLQLAYKKALPGKLSEITLVWEQCCKNGLDESKISKLHQLTHSLSGSGGTYGATTVSSTARLLEMEFKIMREKVRESSDAAYFDDALKKNINEQILSLRIAIKEWQPSHVSYVHTIQDKITDAGNLIYLVDDDTHIADDLLVKLKFAEYNVKYFTNVKDFEVACEKEVPDAIIMDMVFSESDTAGANIITKIKRKVEHCPPVIFISVRNDIEVRLAAAKAGASRYFCKPIDVNKLIKTLGGLTARTETKPFRVLLIDDDKSLLQYYSAILSDAHIDVKTLSNPLECLNVASEFKPDIFVLDIYMPECTGIELAQVIRQDDAWARTPIMFLSTETDINQHLVAMNLGGDDFLIKPIEPHHLVSAVVARAKRARWINRLNTELITALRESEYQTITMDNHDIVSCADIAGCITSVNEKFCKISGYSRAELIGQNHRLLKSKYHDEDFYKDMWRTISSGRVWHGTICNYNKMGEEYWVESTIVPFLDDKGKPYKYVSARTDVTAVRKNEERLERSQAYANIGTWDWNITKDEIYWSSKVKQLYGYPPELKNINYQHFKNRIHPNDVGMVEQAVLDCMEKGVKYDVEHRMLWPDGSVHWMSQRGDVVRNVSGEPIHFLGVAQDITKRIVAEQKQRESEESFSFAVEGAGDGVWDWNMHSNVMKFSRLYMEMLGYDENELPHTIDTWIDSVHPDDLVGVQKKLQEYLEQKIPKYIVELRLSCKDGSYKWILCRGTVVERDKKGKPLRMIGIHSDITRRKENEHALIESREEAETANRAKSQFLSSMSHELRTPMNAIMGFGQLLTMESDNPLNESQKENVQEILKASHHLLDLINEVLDLSQIEAGRIDLSIEDVLLSDVLLESLQLILPLANRQGISIHLVSNETEIDISELVNFKSVVRADHTRTKQVLINLLSNAVKYNSENGKVTIKCSKSSDDYLRISVIDTGAGLDEAQCEKLFTAFNRLGAENSDVEGTGIGLVITKNIIELMGGSIGVESKPKEGTTFWFELPCSNHEVNKKQKEDGLLEIDVDLKEERTVLYIEDNPANLRLVTQLLGRLPNLHMWSAHEPILGLELALEHNPDLILLDINLPGMDGYGVLEHLRQREATRNIPVIAISANAMPKDIEKGLKAGFDDYITKPIDVKALLLAVTKAIDGNIDS